MRTLMLHGHATSAFIFKAQTVPFRSKLDSSFTFDFINGPESCAPPQGLSSVVSTAYTWLKGTDAKAVRKAAAWLTSYIEKSGPYDCICCFSRAAAVVVAMIMYATREGDDNFRAQIMPKCLVLMNGGLEYSFLEDLGLTITSEAQRIKFKTEELVRSKGDVLTKLSKATVRAGATNGLWDDTSKLVHNPAVVPSESSCFGLDMTLLPEDLVIRMPTVHIVGSKDPIWPSGIQLFYLCDAANRTLYDHKGGHDLPRTPKVSNDIARLFIDLGQAIKQ